MSNVIKVFQQDTITQMIIFGHMRTYELDIIVGTKIVFFTLYNHSICNEYMHRYFH